MEEDDEDSLLRCCFVTLGDTRLEFFQLKLGDMLEDESDYKTFYPAVTCADSSAQLLGPSSSKPEHRWMINGIVDGNPAGTVYKITFGLKGTRVSWKAVDSADITGDVLGGIYQHQYFLKCKYAADSLLPLALDGSDSFAGSFKFGPHRREEFVIVRDKDLKQVFHCGGRQRSHVRGPSELDDIESRFIVTGKQSSSAMVALSIRAGALEVRCTTADGSIWQWNNSPDALTFG
jgi:hypothetical protein